MKNIFANFAQDLHNAMARTRSFGNISQVSAGNNTLIINGNSISGNGIEPAGPVGTKVVDIPSFSTLEADSVFDITVRLGAEPKLTFTAEEHVLGHLEAYLSGDRLELAISGSFTTQGPVKADLVVPSLSGISLSGAAKLVFEDVASNTLRVEVSGSARAELAGAVAMLVVNAEGAAQVRANDLSANEVRVDAEGAASVKVCAVNRIRGDVSGAASLKVSGTATQRSVNTSGAASVKYA